MRDIYKRIFNSNRTFHELMLLAPKDATVRQAKHGHNEYVIEGPTSILRAITDFVNTHDGG